MKLSAPWNGHEAHLEPRGVSYAADPKLVRDMDHAQRRALRAKSGGSPRKRMGHRDDKTIEAAR